MENILLELVSAAYPLAECGEAPETFTASGMSFTARRYDARGLGSVCLMEASAPGGVMAMTTLIVNPFEVDAPLFSYDRIQAMGADMLYLELFDTTLGHAFPAEWMEAARSACAAVADLDPGRHWYDDMRVGTPIVKRGAAADKAALDAASRRFIEDYLTQCKAAPACDEDEKRAKASVYSEGLLKNGGPATDPVKAALGEEATARFFRNTLFGTEKQERVDIAHFQNFWKEQQKTAKHMDREQALAHILGFIERHNTCALATGTGDFVRCTPIEYTFMDGEFYLYSEGGDKFVGLEKNLNVSLAIFEYYGDKNDSHGLQVMGRATLYPPRCELFKKVLAFKGIPYDVMKAAKVDVALIRITPMVYEMYDTDFVKAGFDVRQIVRFGYEEKKG